MSRGIKLLFQVSPVKANNEIYIFFLFLMLMLLVVVFFLACLFVFCCALCCYNPISSKGQRQINRLTVFKETETKDPGATQIGFSPMVLDLVKGKYTDTTAPTESASGPTYSTASINNVTLKPEQCKEKQIKRTIRPEQTFVTWRLFCLRRLKKLFFYARLSQQRERGQPCINKAFYINLLRQNGRGVTYVYEL